MNPHALRGLALALTMTTPALAEGDPESDGSGS